MKESKLLLSKFTSEKGFELNNYLTQLFETVRALGEQDDSSTDLYLPQK